MFDEVKGAMKTARELIKENKSANKFSDQWNEDRINKYADAVHLVDFEIRDKRNDYATDTFKDLNKIIKLAEVARKKKAGNCGEVSAIAFVELLKIERIRPLEIIHAEEGWADHAFVLVGRKSNIPFNKPKKWTADMFVADPWANIACPANEYLKLWVEKMQKWEKKGKKIVPDTASSGRTKAPDTRSTIDKEWLNLIEKSIRSSFARQEASSKQCAVM